MGTEMPDFFVGLTPAGLKHGPERPRSDRVDANATLDSLFCQRLCIGHYAALGGRIVQQDVTGFIGLNRRRRNYCSPRRHERHRRLT